MNKLILFCLCFSPLLGTAQTVLERYVEQGLQSNDGLRQKSVQLETALLALREARTQFLPSASLQANYFLAGGGRTVDFPAGDLLNPVYATLNQLTGSQAFPQLENASILLNPDNFYDLKLHITFPLLNAELNYQQRIRNKAISAQQAAVEVYRRELRKEIQQAYYRYLQAKAAEGIYASAVSLAEEGLRVNEALQRNGKATPTSVSRSRSELSRYRAEAEAARMQSRKAMLYFNFLLNRPGDSTLETDSSLVELPVTRPLVAGMREELAQLRSARDIQAEMTRMAGAYRIPRFNAFVDVGSQAFDWQFNDKSRYYFAGFALQWDLFSSGKNRYRQQLARLEEKNLSIRYDELGRQLELQQQQAQLSLEAKRAQYLASREYSSAAERGFNDLNRQYQQGTLLQIELLDARNQWVQARLQENLLLYDCWIAFAEAERAAATLQP